MKLLLLFSLVIGFQCASAMEQQTYELAQLILPKGVDINAPNNCGQTRLHLAVVFSDASPAAIPDCKSLLRQGASVALKNKDGRSPLYIAAVNQKSFALTQALLTTCPSLKPALKQLLLIGNRLGRPLPKDLLLFCIVPFIVANETERHLKYIQPLLMEVVNTPTVCRPNPMAGRNVRVTVNKKLHDVVESKELKNLLNPNNIEQLRQPIKHEFFKSLGIVEQKKSIALTHTIDQKNP